MQPRRTRRYLGLDNNPLRRRADRVQAWLVVLLAGIFLSAVPVTAWYTAGAVYRNALHTARATQRDVVQVNSTLEEDAVPAIFTSYNSELVRVPVRTRWTGPDGKPHVGFIPLALSAPAGTVIPVWVDARGNITRAPRAEADLWQDGLIAGLLVVVCGFGVWGGLSMLLRLLVDCRRMAWWQTEWTHVEPRWTGRR
jgi:hypothetical protein